MRIILFQHFIINIEVNDISFFRFGSRMTSSDDDIDPELKEGIKNIM